MDDKKVADRIRKTIHVIVLFGLISVITLFVLAMWVFAHENPHDDVAAGGWFLTKLFIVLPIVIWLVYKFWVFLDSPDSIEEWIGVARRVKTAFARSMAAGFSTKPHGKSRKTDALRCENCGKAIPKFMKLQAWDGHVVCATCMQMLKESDSNKAPRREKRGPISPADSQK